MTDVPPTTRPTGDYTVRRGQDTYDERHDAVRVLMDNGCKDWRFEPQPDGTLIVHGFLQQGTAKFL